MENVIMYDEHSEHATTRDPSGNILTVDVSTISDLPREVMEFIFEKLDSINRKKIERVCKGWMEIIRGVRKFRTHIQIELPLFTSAHECGCCEPSYEDWSDSLRHLVKPDLEVLQLKSRKLPVDLESDLLEWNVVGNRVHDLMWALSMARVNFSKVDLIFSDCIIDYEQITSDRDGWSPHAKKTRILRSHIRYCNWFAFPATLFFEELWLDENLLERPRQIMELFLAEHGPLTEEQSGVLRDLGSSLVIDRAHTHRLAIRLSNTIGLCAKDRFRFRDDYNWLEALTTIANGGHVSKHTACFLKSDWFDHILRSLDSPLH